MKHRLTHYTEPWHIQAQGEENKRQAQLKLSVSNPLKQPEILNFQLEASAQVQQWTSAPSCLEAGLVNMLQVGQAVSLITREM